MDFASNGGVENKRASYRAHVQWSDEGVNRNIRGPCRPDLGAAQDDLDAMRSLARGMGREEGYAAMEAEAKRRREGKVSKEQGSVKQRDGGRYRRPSVAGSTVALPFRD